MIDPGLLNPFLGPVVPNPWKPVKVDVPEIHAEAFLQCRQAVVKVQKTFQSTSLIIHGAAGSGKTHLLGRLRLYLAGVPSVFIYVPLKTSRHLLWRHLRRCLVDDLLQPVENDQNQFNKVTALRMRKNGLPLESWLSQIQMDHDLSRVLSHLVNNEHLRETRAWLRGDSLSEIDLAQLGLPSTAEDEEAPEDKACRVVLSLCRLFGSDICLVFCFDQVEALQNSPQEKSGFFAFGKMVGALHDGTENALLISCLQTSFLDPLLDSVDKADQDRLTSGGKFSLDPLNFDQAISLIEARLAAISELARTRSGPSRLWPLNESDIKAFFEHRSTGTIVAREVIARCEHLFEAARGRPEAPAVKSSDYLEQEWQDRLENWASKNRPEDFDQIIQHGLPQLLALRDNPWREKSDGLFKDIDLIFFQPQGDQIEVSLCNQQNMASLAAQLKRLLGGLKNGKFRKLILMRDPRRPIKATAKKTIEYLTELKDLGVRMIHPPLEVLAAVDALRALLSEARAGDLASGGRSLDPDSLAQWLAQNLPSALQDFMDNLSASEKDLFPDEALLALLEERPLLKLTEAAALIEQSPGSLEAWVRGHPGLIGFLYGPPALLYQRVPDSFPSEGSV